MEKKNQGGQLANKGSPDKIDDKMVCKLILWFLF